MNESADFTFAERGLRALRKAVADTVEEHRRLGLPLVISRDGEVVEVMAEEIDRMMAEAAEKEDSLLAV